MNERLRRLLRLSLPDRAQPRATYRPTDDNVVILSRSIVSLAVSLDIPRDLLVPMLDLAFDAVPRYDMPSNDALMYAYMLSIFTLYDFTADDYARMCSIVRPLT